MWYKNKELRNIFCFGCFHAEMQNKRKTERTTANNFRRILQGKDDKFLAEKLAIILK